MILWSGAHRRLATIAGFGIALLASQHASALHDDERGITDGTARTLPGGDVRLGPGRVEVSVADAVTLGTTAYAWLLLLPNLHAKWRYLKNERWQLSAGLGVFAWNSKRLKSIDEESGNAKFNIAPVELFATYALDPKWFLSGGPVYTFVRGSGEIRGETLDFVADGAVDNLQLLSKLEHRVSRVTALTLTGRVLLLQLASASGTSTSQIDEFTTVTIEGGASTDAVDFKGAASLVLGTHFSWEHFNLRVGLGYGHFNLPVVNFVAGMPSVVPEFDLYWVL